MPELYEPRDSGCQDCPTKPKVSQGKVTKPTKEQRTSIRREDRGAYRSILRKLDADRDSQELSQPTTALSESMDTETLPSWPLHQPPEAMMEAQAIITNVEHDARNLTDPRTSGRAPVSTYDYPDGTCSPEILLKTVPSLTSANISAEDLSETPSS